MTFITHGLKRAFPNLAVRGGVAIPVGEGGKVRFARGPGVSFASHLSEMPTLRQVESPTLEVRRNHTLSK
jgi:hypothetical protein